METKVCTKCGLAKPLNQFLVYTTPTKTSAARVGRPHSSCRSCKTEAKRWYMRGVTKAWVQKQWELQNKRCYLCDKKGDPFAKPRPTLVIDHNHITGKVRKLLCGICNWRIGLLEISSVEWLENAVEYMNIDD